MTNIDEYSAPPRPTYAGELTDETLFYILSHKAFVYFNLDMANVEKCSAVTILDYVESLEAAA